MIIPIEPWLQVANDPAKSPSRFLGFDDLTHGSGSPIGSLSAKGLPSLPASAMEFYHESILSREICEAMSPLVGKQIFDGTLGGGGHTEAFLRQGAHVIGCDQDEVALKHASSRLSDFGDQFLPVRGNFREIDEILEGHGIDLVDGILLDIGVSSRQLDDVERGFSFRGEGALDMRMDQRADFSAKELVNEWSEEELVRIFRDFGEERAAKRVTREILKVRANSVIETTAQLVDLVASVIPKTSKRHPATKVFQAIRIAVNRELESLEIALEKSIRCLAPGGVLAIISFHSLEDRIVKQFMRRHSEAMLDRPEWPAPRPNPDFHFTLPTRRAVVPGEAEIERNPRSRSAKLRVAVRN